MLMLIFKITTLLIPISAFVLGIFSLLKNPKSKVVWLWFLSSIAIGTWGLGLYMLVVAKTASEAFLASKVLHSGSTFIPALFYHFVTSFLLQEKKNKILIIIGYIASFVFLLINLSSSLVIAVTPRAGFNFWVEDNPVYVCFFLFFLFYVVVSLAALCRGYIQSDGLKRTQIFYILIAVFIGFSGGTTDFFPQIFNIYPFGSFVVFLYPTLISYGVFLKK